MGEPGLGAAADPALDRFAGLVRTSLRVPVALVSLLDGERHLLAGAAGLGEPWLSRREVPLDRSFGRHVTAGGRPLVASDVRADDRFAGAAMLDGLAVAAYAGVPLTGGDPRVLGTLCAIDDRPRRWSDHDLEVLTGLAGACSEMLRLRTTARVAEATAGERSRPTRSPYDRTQALLNASVALTSTTTVSDVVTAVGRLARGSIEPAYVGVLLFDPDRRELTVAAGDPLPAGLGDLWARFPLDADTPAAEVVRTGRPLLHPDPGALAAAYPHLAGSLQRLRWRALADLPLAGDAGTMGVLRFAWSDPHRVERDELAMLVTLAAYVTQALHRARHLADRVTAATTLQKALLTDLPRLERLHIAARYQPAHRTDDVGGDWYDAIVLPDDRLALVIGDVTGHNLGATARMSELRSMLRGFLIDRHEPPSALLRRLDHANQALGAWTIASVLVAFLDPDPAGGHTLSWANAGHPPPVLLLPDGTVTPATPRDTLIGVRRHLPRRSHTLAVPPGTTLVLHTDGLVEERGSTLDEGNDKLRRLLAGHAGTDLDELAEVVLGHTARVYREDDVALLLVRTPG